MNILIDIGHPAHVHLFKNFANILISKGNKVFFSARDKENEIYLLKRFGFNYCSFGPKYTSRIGKLYGLLKYNVLLLKYALKIKPDIFVSHGSMYASHVAWLLRKPHISMEDTGNMEQVRLYKPFTKAILTSTSFLKDFGKKQIRYSGYHELAYLHPNYFSPDELIKIKLGLSKDDKYVIIRLVSWKATHDKGHTGLSLDVLMKTIEILQPNYKIFLSAEGELPKTLEKYKFILPPEEMHNALAFADLFIGEGATMASECAMLGTPAFYVNTIEAGSINEQEKLGLLFHFRDPNDVLLKLYELISVNNFKSEFIARKNQMLKENIDVTSFLVWFVENYPASVQIVKENPDYQLKFR